MSFAANNRGTQLVLIDINKWVNIFVCFSCSATCLEFIQFLTRCFFHYLWSDNFRSSSDPSMQIPQIHQWGTIDNVS